MNTPLDRIVATDQRFKALEKAAQMALEALNGINEHTYERVQDLKYYELVRQSIIELTDVLSTTVNGVINEQKIRE